MIAIIQCAGRKQPHAGRLTTKQGTPVLFVASPGLSTGYQNQLFARPDDLSDDGRTWRQRLLAYNETPQSNPLRLLQAYRLYQNPIYARLVEKFGMSRVLILSAGWGLIRADFLTPDYDITFSTTADALNRRRKTDAYRDVCMLPDTLDEPVVFFGGKDYLALLSSLTGSVKGTKTAFFNSATSPSVSGWTTKRFVTTTRTNWHYECAAAFLEQVF